MGRGASGQEVAAGSGRRVSPDSLRLQGEARRYSDALVEVGAEGVALFGSVARGVAGAASDIDLICVFEDDIPGRLGDFRPPHVDAAVEPAFTRWDRIEKPGHRYVFFKVIAAEGIYLHDPGGRLRRTLEELPFPDAYTLRSEARELRARVPRLRDIGRGEGPGAWVHADCYRWAKSAALQANVLRGEMVHGRSETLAALVGRHPELAEDVEWLSYIEPIYMTSMRKGTEAAHPFRGAGSAGDLHRSLAAADRVVEASALEIEALAGDHLVSAP